MLTNGYSKIKTLRNNMLSIIATLIVALSSVIVFFIDESHTAFGLSFVVLLCACAITLHSDYSKDDIGILGRLKIYCIITMALICFHLSMAGLRISKYFEEGDRFAVISLINFIVAELFLTYSLICTIIILKKTKDRTPLRNEPV